MKFPPTSPETLVAYSPSLTISIFFSGKRCEAESAANTSLLVHEATDRDEEKNATSQYVGGDR